MSKDTQQATEGKQMDEKTREKQLQGQLHEISMAEAAYNADPTSIGKYLSDRQRLVFDGLAEHQAKMADNTNDREG